VLGLWLRFGRGTSWNKSELGGMAGLDPELSCGYATAHPTLLNRRGVMWNQYIDGIAMLLMTPIK
jgi:hypothetical protein